MIILIFAMQLHKKHSFVHAASPVFQACAVCINEDSFEGVTCSGMFLFFYYYIVVHLSFFNSNNNDNYDDMFSGKIVFEYKNIIFSYKFS